MEEKPNTGDQSPQAQKPNSEIFPVETMLTGIGRPKRRDYSPNQRYNRQQKKYEPLQHFSKITILKKLLLPIVLLLVAVITIVFVNRQQSLNEEKLTTLLQPTPTLTNLETTVPSDWNIYTNLRFQY